MDHYKKPAQEKSPTKIIIHVGTNNLSSNKKTMDIANHIMQPANSVKTDVNVSIVTYQGKTNLIARQRKLTHIYKIYIPQRTFL